VIYKTWLDVNFLNDIKDLPDCVCELFEVELEAQKRQHGLLPLHCGTDDV